MAWNKKYKWEETQFVTPPGIGAFLKLLPEHAKPYDNDPLSYSYGLELWVDSIPTDSTLYKAVATVAYNEAPEQWEKCLFGGKGTFRKLEEMDDRTLSKYPRAHGKHVLSLSSVLKPSSKQISMEGADFTNPAVREKFLAKVHENAPRVFKYCDPSVESERARMEEKNQELMRMGQPPVPEHEWHKRLIPALPGEFWPGCIFQVAGNAYWPGPNAKKRRPFLGVNYVLLVRQGERLIAEVSPDEVFGELKTDPSMAPVPPAGLRYPAPAPSAPPVAAPPAFMQAPKQQEGWAI